MASLALPPFHRVQIAAPTLGAVRAVAADWEALVVDILDHILTRHERHADYPFIDTKLNLITGEEFPTPTTAEEQAQDFKGPTAVYGWIQGRGLEALVGHARWLPECTVLPARERTALEERTRAMIARVLEAMETLRARMNGRVPFVFTPEGQPFERDPATGRRRAMDGAPATCGFGDCFYVKGLQAAARYLAQPARQQESRAYMRLIADDIASGRFQGEYLRFDPQHGPAEGSGRTAHGPRMIAIGCAALFARHFPTEDEWFDLGCEYIRYILSRHVHLGQLPPLNLPAGAPGIQLYDMFEATDAQSRPWREPDGRILSDPGHSTEFVGLACKFLFELERRPHKTPAQEMLLTEARAQFPAILLRNFRNGFRAPVGGICKSFDLVARQPVNADLPWWNLPETMRAAVHVLRLCPGLDAATQRELWEVVQACSNGSFRTFVNGKVHRMAYQTVSPEGRPIPVIPATPDADPGYHTGLCVIDFLRALARLA
ncbi:MAG: hypothetical protein ACREJ2_00610 [Planctomycetota bacterium]